MPVLWCGMDFKGAAGKEVTALQARQQYRCWQPSDVNSQPVVHRNALLDNADNVIDGATTREAAMAAFAAR